MKRVALLIALIFAGCRTAPVTQQNPYAHRSEAVLAGGKLFDEHCAACHGIDADGRGAVPSLRTPAVRDRSDGALFSFITNGDLRRGMPSWSRLPAERRWQIVSYLRSLSPNAFGP